MWKHPEPRTLRKGKSYAWSSRRKDTNGQLEYTLFIQRRWYKVPYSVLFDPEVETDESGPDDPGPVGSKYQEPQIRHGSDEGGDGQDDGGEPEDKHHGLYWDDIAGIWAAD